MDRQFQREIVDTKALVDLLADMVEVKKKEARVLLIALIVSVCVNLATVGAFLFYEAHMETTVTTTTTQKVDGKDNDIVNGDQYNDESQNRSVE